MRPLKDLKVLNASGNHVRRIPPAVFAQFRQLQALVLNNNEIPEVPPTWFKKGLLSLNTLVLSHNKVLRLKFSFPTRRYIIRQAATPSPSPSVWNKPSVWKKPPACACLRLRLRLLGVRGKVNVPCRGGSKQIYLTVPWLNRSKCGFLGSESSRLLLALLRDSVGVCLSLPHPVGGRMLHSYS